MTLKTLDNFAKNIKGKLRFDYCLKNRTWFNIGGNAKIFFVPETLAELRDFLLNIKKDHNNLFIMGAGSNLLISDKTKNRIFIKLGKNFNKLSLTKDNVVIAGCSILDKNVSDFACENHLSGLEFLSCIPGTVGGGIRMNSGCFGSEFKDVLLSVQVMDFGGKVYTINSKDISFNYRKTNLPKKNCRVCSKPFTWRKKWRLNWEKVKYCSKKCSRSNSI